MGKNPEPDERLMRDVAAGQRECLAPLVQRYATPLLTYIHRMIGDRHRAEELLQETFFAVWWKRQQYQYPRPFRAWLFAIATNCCRADFRKTKHYLNFSETTEAEMLTSGETPPNESALEAETAARLSAAVGKLPTQQRTVLVLRIWEGMSYAEIASTVERSEATVRSHMHHALAALRRSLDDRH